MIREIMISAIIGIFTTVIGCVLAVFIAEVFFNALPLAEMFIAGLVIYLSIVVIICTRLIMKKMNEISQKSWL